MAFGPENQTDIVQSSTKVSIETCQDMFRKLSHVQCSLQIPIPENSADCPPLRNIQVLSGRRWGDLHFHPWGSNHVDPRLPSDFQGVQRRTACLRVRMGWDAQPSGRVAVRLMVF